MTTWWYVSNGQRMGPIGDEELRRLLISGTLASRSLVWKAGMPGWQPAAEVAGLAPALSVPPEIPGIPQSASAGSWRRIWRHLGSSLALVFGCLAAIAGIAQVGNGVQSGSAVGGAVMVIGALAYRSAKKRRLGEVNSTLIRRTVEYALLLSLILIVLLQNNLKYLIASDPVNNAVIPLWAVIAYTVGRRGGRSNLARISSS
jgi:hypothetical protein